MRVYTYSEARQKLAAVLDRAEKDGAVRIRHRDGRSFTLQRLDAESSPLAVNGIDLQLDRKSIVDLVRESRRPRRR
jgi:hypothetical protein